MTNPITRKALFILLIASLLIALAHSAPAARAASQPGTIWSDQAESAITVSGIREIFPERFRLLQANTLVLRALLFSAPLESAASGSSVTLTLPMPDGRNVTFYIQESPIMEAPLAARYPQIKTFSARGVEDASLSGRLDWTPFGFHAMLFTPQGQVFIDPYQRGDVSHYLSYYKRDYPRHPDQDFYELDVFSEQLVNQVSIPMPETNLKSGEQLRTYRAAVAATGEYTQYFGGTVPQGLAAIVTAMNRITGIYEREVAVRMVLVANNDLIVYTDPAKDPYSNNDGVAMLSQNQTNLDAVIGSANYDIGHVFSTGGGGVAYLGVPCVANWKARGVTGSSVPNGDAFWVDYVAHEMGHQFGANHTFNGTQGSCSGGNRNASTAYEPGSATTIMGYAGICGSDNIQPHSDDYFHNISWVEIINYTQSGSGNTCPVITSTGNHAPTVNAGSGGFTIPKSTPFTLTGSGSDPDGDAITFCWEEWDLGPAGSPDSPSGTAPIFRSFNPVSSPSRTFPQMSDIINNTHTKGELLPTYARALNFRLTARDNRVSPGAGGVAYGSISFSVSGTAGPFLVTAPNTAVTWQGNSTQTVTWDVAGTNAAPINCSAVNIDLSTDGGWTYPIPLLAGTPNDGTQTITVPNLNTTTARVRVMCANNIFFDISNANFTIQVVNQAVLGITKSVNPIEPLSSGDALTYTINATNSGNLAATATITDSFPTGFVNPLCNGIPGNLNLTATIDPSGSQVVTCTAQVNPALEIATSIEASPSLVLPGQPVTIVITVTNPNAGITVNNITLGTPGIVNCSPNPTTPISLAPSASQVYTCANNTFTTTTTLTVTANGNFILSNTASVSAPEATISPVTSTPVNSQVNLDGEASTTVTVVSERRVYLPFIVYTETW